MLVYFIIFFISYLFAYLSEKNYKKNNKKCFIILSFIAVMIPSIFAGIRASGIGTDTKVYIDYIFYNMKSVHGLNNLLSILISNDEFLYLIINFLVSRVSDSPNLLYFVLQFLIMMITYVTCFDNRNNNSFSFSYLLFMILYYNLSLNMCRQTLSIVIILYSLKFILKKSFIKFIFLVFIAMGFHSSSIIAILIYPIIRLIEKKHNFFNKIFILSIIILFIISFDFILAKMSTIFPVLTKYLRYINGSSGNISYFSVVFKSMLIISSTIFYNKIFSNNRLNEIYYFLVIVGFLLYFVGIYGSYVQRISMYCSYFSIFLIPSFVTFCKSYKNKMLTFILIIIISISYSYIQYDYFGWSETVPYRTYYNK